MVDRYRCEDCTLWFEADTEATRCDKCASRLGEGALTPSPTNSVAPTGTGMWNGWSWYHAPGKVPHLLPVEVDLGIPSTVPEGGVLFLDLADTLVTLDRLPATGKKQVLVAVGDTREWVDEPLSHPPDFIEAISMPTGIVNDFRALRRLFEDTIVQAFGIPAHLIAPAFAAKPNPDGVADFKAHLLRWVADKIGLDAEIHKRGLVRE